ncbi:TetR/AcrR family transcriptional regulator [Paenibacillus sp. KQZ6P-2]|uniref:TetR/AcrR family transcriptional regulator n=1 Tax=Paenibacillus mangrovi TaxID=2931978 RepID=A0A9X2B277_9BACL|nr:TetR/AcrR family transcriptional regulator [Paenibacillus mangrovi]MCJ8011640.1 TetR/AcrR family transcriptional regulator [Paenibacillus mangrovi]
MSPLNKKQLDQIKDERRAQIKEAGLQLFARHGFGGTKTSMIAAEAGVSEGLIYRYFKSKDELFISIVQELMEEGKRETEEVPRLPGSPYEQIKSLTENMLSENKYAFMLILQAARKPEEIPEEAAKIFESYSAEVMIEPLVPVFIKGQESGEFIAGDPHQLLNWYMYVINSLILDEVGEKEYGAPSVELLMRMLKS